ncbi:hypothetical protein RUND412_002891 [Rhizina undulata]
MNVTDESGLALPGLSSTGYEYYLMIPSSSGCSPEVPTYRKLLLALDPSDTLDEHQVVAIEDLLKERNARTEIEGEWVLSGLRMAVGSENFELIIKFRGYSDFVVLRGMDVVTEAVEDCRNDAPDVDVSNSRETAMIVAEGAVAEISGSDTQQPDLFVDDSDFESTVGRRSPTPTSDIDSSAITPIPVVIRTEKEIQIDELDALEEVACKCAESLNGQSVTVLSLLKGVLDARKTLMGKEHLQTLKTTENLGHCGRPKNLFGEKDERTLTAIYKLANLDHLTGFWRIAWQDFEKVLHGRAEILGKTHEETLDTLKRLEEIYRKDCRKCGHGHQVPFLRTLVKCETEVRGENHQATIEAMDLLAYRKWRDYLAVESSARFAETLVNLHLHYIALPRLPAFLDGRVCYLSYHGYIHGNLLCRSNPFQYT